MLRYSIRTAMAPSFGKAFPRIAGRPRVEILARRTTASFSMCPSVLRPITDSKALKAWKPKVDWLRCILRPVVVRGRLSFPSRPIVPTRHRGIARQQIKARPL